MEPRASGSKYADQSPTYRPYQASNKRLSTSTTASPPLASRSLGSSQNPDSVLASPVALYKKAQSTTPTQSNTVGISNGRRIGTPPPSFPFSTVPSNSSPFSSSPRRSGSPVQSTSTPTNSNSNSNSNGNDKIRVPYHSAFQPQGMRRDRTDEFLSRRKARGEGKKLEEGRLGRRLEKLVALHYPTPSVEGNAIASSSTGGFSSIAELRGKSAKDIWRSVSGGPTDADLAEQSIVKWQEDSEATRCPICMTAFGIKTRRHHCRLCGRVVCFLPPTPPTLPSHLTPSVPVAPVIPVSTRRQRCSTFITYEYDNRTITANSGEKGKAIGTVIEIETTEPDLSMNGVMMEKNAPPKIKDERKKVRVCRECLNVALRQQAQNTITRVPDWIQLYEVLVELEKEIEELLPEFQELVLGLQKPPTSNLHLSTSPPSTAAAHVLRKSLLTNLSSYDLIAKRITTLPLTSDGIPGGSQDRLQRAVGERGVAFLREKLGVLRTLGNFDGEEKKGVGKKKKGSQKRKDEVISLKKLMGEEEEEGGGGGQTSQLNVLLEQEALVTSYINDANSRRQFEDAASLSFSLIELREEIARLRLNPIP